MTVVVVQCVGQGHPMCVIGVDCGCCSVCRARASRVLLVLTVTVVVVQCVGQGHPVCVIGVDRGCGCCPVCRARASCVCYWC